MCCEFPPTSYITSSEGNLPKIGIRCWKLSPSSLRERIAPEFQGWDGKVGSYQRDVMILMLLRILLILLFIEDLIWIWGCSLGMIGYIEPPTSDGRVGRKDWAYINWENMRTSLGFATNFNTVSNYVSRHTRVVVARVFDQFVLDDLQNSTKLYSFRGQHLSSLQNLCWLMINSGIVLPTILGFLISQ